MEDRLMFRLRTVALLLTTCLAQAESALDQSWKSPGRTIKGSDYTVAMRDGRCVTGPIRSFDDRYVTVGASKLQRYGGRVLRLLGT